jgi:hypothetical protein
MGTARPNRALGGQRRRLESLFRILKSENRAWNDAQVFSVRFSNPEMRQQGIMQRRMVVIHADGDRTLLEYEFTWSGGATSDFSADWSVCRPQVRQTR